MALIIGVTGGIGSGKTTVTNLFSNKGVDIIDADIIAREVVAKGSDALDAISEHFGKSMLLADGQLNRAKLREKIFREADAKIWLENMLYPKIHQAINQALEKSHTPYSMLVAPLLFENKLNLLCQRVLVIDVTREEQIIRTCQRDSVSREQVEAILSAQLSRQERLKLADDVVLNHDLLTLNLQVKNLHAKYLSLS